MEKKYTVAKKRQSHRQTLEPKDAKPSKSSIIMNPKDTYFSLEVFNVHYKEIFKITENL